MLFRLGMIGLALLVIVVIPGNMLRLGLRRGYSPQRCIVQTSLLLIGMILLWLGLTAWQVQPNPWLLWKQEFEKSLIASMQLYKQWGWDAAELRRAAQMIRLIFLDAAIGWLVIAVTALTLFLYTIQRRLRPDLPGAQIPLPRFANWPILESMIWPLMFFLLLLLTGESLFGWPRWVAVNGLFVLGSYYFLMGLAIIFFYLEKRAMARGLKIMVLVLIMLFPGFMFFLTGIGIFDTWWDWRRLRRPIPPVHPI